jgi:uncharacterized protein (TIGR03435 family)
MLREFLSDRFQLRLHLETKNLPSYYLVVSAAGNSRRPTAFAIPRTTDCKPCRCQGRFRAGKFLVSRRVISPA